MRFHFLRDEIEKGVINVEFVGTNENVADVLTKAVCQNKLDYCAGQMGLINLSIE
jgi:hypothetical protein